MRRRRWPGSAIAGWAVLAAFVPLGLFLAYLPAVAGLWLGRRFGDLAWALLPGRRAIALGNLALALGPERTLEELHRIGRGSFRHLGMNAVEACVLFFRPPSVLLSRVAFRGAEHLEAAAGRGRGVLLLTAHYGNWELLAASHVLTPFALSIVMRPLDHPLLDRVVARLRERTGAELITKRRGLREVLDALRRGRMVGILLDQNASRNEGLFAPFFGLLASTSRGMAVIALRTGAPVVPVFITRDGGGRHCVEVEPALAPPPDGDPIAYTARFNEAIEAAVRRAPEQWFWVHRRWKTRPPGEAA